MGEQLGQPGGDALDGALHGGRGRLVKLQMGSLHHEQAHLTVELADEEISKNRGGQGMGGGGEAVHILPIHIGDGAGGLIQMGGVDQQDEIGGKAAQGTGEVFGGGADIQDEAVRGGQRHQAARHQNPGGVVPVEFIAQANQRQPQGLALGLAGKVRPVRWALGRKGCQRLAELLFPGGS